MSDDPLVVARFWSKVQVRRPGQCWPWQSASRHSFGYGVFKPSKADPVTKAHRFAWQLANGRIPDGLVVRHRCDNPPCCNPAHLELGRQSENIADMHSRKRRRYGTTFTAKDLALIQERVSKGETQTSIAEDLGVSQSYISMLTAGRRGQAIRKGISSNGK